MTHVTRGHGGAAVVSAVQHHKPTGSQHCATPKPPRHRQQGTPARPRQWYAARPHLLCARTEALGDCWLRRAPGATSRCSTSRSPRAKSGRRCCGSRESPPRRLLWRCRCRLHQAQPLPHGCNATHHGGGTAGREGRRRAVNTQMVQLLCTHRQSQSLTHVPKPHIALTKTHSTHTTHIYTHQRPKQPHTTHTHTSSTRKRKKNGKQ